MDYTTLNTAAEILEAFRACNNSGEEIALFEYLATRPDAPVGAFVEILKKIKLEPLLALTIQAFGKITNAGIKANLQQSENLLIMLSQQAESGSSDLIKWSAATAITEIGFDFFMVAQYLSEAPEQIVDRIVKLKIELGRGTDEFVRFSKYGPLHSRWRQVDLLSMKPPHQLKLVSPDGQTLFSRGSGDNTIKIWQVGKGEVCSLIGHTENYIKDIAITPDGQTLFSCDSRTIRMWQVSTGKELHCISSDPSSRLAISPDGQTFFSYHYRGTIKMWQVSTGREIGSFIGHTGNYGALAISPDGNTLFSSSGDGTIRMWQVSTGKELHCITSCGQGQRIDEDRIHLVISPDGQTLFSSSNDGTIRMWQVSTGKELHTITDCFFVDSLAISPDGQALFSIVWGAIEIWQVSTGKKLWTFSSYVYSSPYHYVAISPDGKTLFTHRTDIPNRGHNSDKEERRVIIWRLD